MQKPPPVRRGLFYMRGTRAMKSVEIFDTTLRDGEQAAGGSMSISARARIARMLDAFGVDTIEAGFPAASEVIANSVAQIAGAVRGSRVAALARCVQTDIDIAARCVARAK